MYNLGGDNAGHEIPGLALKIDRNRFVSLGGLKIPSLPVANSRLDP